MESLLALSFDNLSSRDVNKIRKGIRQIEGLLAQICLSKSSSRSPHKRKSSVLSEQSDKHASPKSRVELRHDPAFREFFRLQEGFQWNVASHLLTTLETLLGLGQPDSTDALILSTLDLVQGILILHPPSRILFARESALDLLLDLLDPTNPPAVQSQTLLVLVAALLDQPANARAFEAADGLLAVTSLFKSRGTSREVRLRSMEFVYFYLLPETAAGGSAPGTMVAAAGEQGEGLAPLSREARHVRTHSGEVMSRLEADGDGPVKAPTRTTEEKQKLLGRYLPNAADIAQDLKNSAPFGTAVAA